MNKNKIKKAVPFALAMVLSTGAMNVASIAATVNSGYTETVNTSDGVKVKTYDELVNAITSGKTKIYILNDIKMNDGFVLSKGSQSIIGVPDKSGALPVLDFVDMKGKNDIINNKSGDADVGIKITSSHNVIKNLVIQKAHDNGILIKGVNATGNHISNCIVRYNNDSGIQVSNGSCGNIFTSIYSYRNCDVFTLGSNADGFAIKLGAGPSGNDSKNFTTVYKSKNTFTDCYAWENGDDGWDSYDKELADQSDEFKAEGGRWTYRNDYTNCMCWGNGSPATCVGYTDYINGAKLDENLPFIMRFKDISSEATYKNFVDQYNSGKLCSKTASEAEYLKKLDDIFGEVPTTKGNLLPSAIVSDNWSGNPNGFKFGSKFTPANAKRYVKNCISFDHKKYGFDKNNAGAKIYAENCISFDNGANYHLETFTANKWNNIYGWGAEIADDLPKAGNDVKVAVKKAEDKETTIRNSANSIVNSAKQNKIVSSNIFTTIFK